MRHIFLIKIKKQKKNKYKQTKISHSNHNYKSLEFELNKKRNDLILCMKYKQFIALKSKHPDILSAVDMMDRDLGYFTTKQSKQYKQCNNDKNKEMVHSLDDNQSLYCFVEETGHKIVGCVVCEPREFAFKIKENVDGDIVERNDSKKKCFIGIVKIWIHSEFRRKCIASLLMDCIRTHFIYGTNVNKAHVAFCQPTRIGRSFAEKYCQTKQILVY